MADHHQIVDQIRAFLQASDQTRNERLDGLALDYANACTEANQRLTGCHRLLQQGLRSEAIQQAEAEPRLLDALTTLDFAERNEWDELVDIYAMAAAPKLMADARAALNDAYAEAEPLQNLLRTHRRLATQRAPVRDAHRHHAQARGPGRQEPDLVRRLAHLRESANPPDPDRGGRGPPLARRPASRQAAR